MSGDPRGEALPEGVPVGEWVEALEAGSCDHQPMPCPPRGGILVSEARAVRDGLFRVRYDELRVHYMADREVWGAQRELYEGALREADRTVHALRPSWWQQNALGLGFAGGLLVALVGVSLTAFALR